MTMDDGEGRPLDEAESSSDDPQSWYFDLPGGAWERQEEKNRNLRERVLGNIQEDEASPPKDPFVSKPAPEPEKKRGFFGRSKKVGEDESRTSAGGTWILNRGGDGPEPTGDLEPPVEPDDEWTTEPPLKLAPFPRSVEREPWGDRDNGWDLSSMQDAAAREALPRDAHPEQTPDEDFLAGMRAWAEAPASEERAELTTIAELRPHLEATQTAADGSFEGQEPGKTAFGAPRLADFLVEAEPGDTDGEPSVASVPAWEPRDDEVPEAPVASGRDEHDDEELEEASSPSPLLLRPRQIEPGGKRLDWDFGPAAWSEREQSEDAEEAAAIDDADAELNLESMKKWAEKGKDSDHPHFTTVRDEPETEATPQPISLRPREQAEDAEQAPAIDDPAPEMNLESIKQWAEQGKDSDHPHFTTAHAEIQTEAEPQPIPLRPRHQTEAERHASAFSPLPPTDPDNASGKSPTLPIVLRSRTEPAEPAPAGEPSDTPTKWDDFFNITPDSTFESTEATSGDDAEPSLEGLAAMRAWALRQEESNTATAIPEEFLKPFDWELQEDGSDDVSSAPADGPAEFLKPSAWEEAEEDESSPEDVLSDGQLFGADDSSPSATEELEDGAEAVLEPAATFEAPAAESAEPLADFLDDDDPLAGLFESAAAMKAAEQEPKTKGRFGRLFGRKKGRDESPPEPTDSAKNDWLVSADEAEDPDFRTVAHGEWAEDAVSGQAIDEAAASGAGQGASTAPGWVDQDTGVIEEFSSDITEEESPFARFEPAVLRPEQARSPVEDDAWAPEPFDSPTMPTESQAQFVAAAQLDPFPTADFSSAPWFDHDGPIEGLPAEREPERPVARHDERALILWEPDSENWWAHAEVPASAETLPARPNVVVVTIDSPSDELEKQEETFASTEPILEPVAEETPWWEHPAQDSVAEVPAEVTASTKPMVEPVAEETPWWEQRADSIAEVPADVAASTDPIVETVAEETPWWEHPAQDSVAEVPAEATASTDPIVEPAAEETPWWEQPADDSVAEGPADVTAATASTVEPIAEVTASTEPSVEPVAKETPWWEQPAGGDSVAEVPAEGPTVDAPAAVPASAEDAVEPAYGETPWWEQPAEEPTVDAPVAAVGSAEAETQPGTEATSWWDRPTEAPVAGLTSNEPLAEPAETAAWWEQRADEPEFEAPAAAFISADLPGRTPEDLPWSPEPAEPEASQSVFSGDAEGDSGPSSDEVGSDQVPEWTTGEPLSGGPNSPEAGAPPEPAAASTLAAADHDDPWADFVSGAWKAEGAVAPEAAPATWQKWESPPARDEAMWSEVASAAHAGAADPAQEIDLAASLESQMAERTEPAYQWEPEQSDDSAEEWEAARPATAPTHQPGEDENVVLAAFERHAATPDALPPRNDEVFEELLGEEAAAIVAEADDGGAGHRSFIKMSGWAPQRGTQGFDGGWAPEQEVEQALGAHQPPAFGGTDGGGFAPPPWALEEFDGEAELPHEKGRHRTKTWIRELVETGLLALLVFLSVRASFQNFKVEGTSMYPTLEDGQFLIVNKLVYSEVNMDKLGNFIPFIDGGSNPERNVFHGPERGDIVVLKDPRNPETDLIKRVIGLPGETLEIADGKVYINDRLLDEPYIKQAWHDTKPRVTIPPGEYFVMGDNRENSLDSRSSQVGLVAKDLIIGKAMLSYWPSKQFGLAPNEEGKLGDQKPVLTTQRIEGN